MIIIAENWQELLARKMFYWDHFDSIYLISAGSEIYHITVQHNIITIIRNSDKIACINWVTPLTKGLLWLWLFFEDLSLSFTCRAPDGNCWILLVWRSSKLSPSLSRSGRQVLSRLVQSANWKTWFQGPTLFCDTDSKGYGPSCWHEGKDYFNMKKLHLFQ